MVVLLLFVVICLPYVVREVVRSRRARMNDRAGPTPDARLRVDDAVSDRNLGAQQSWSALDQHQLTRLPTQAAHRSTTEQDTP